MISEKSFPLINNKESREPRIIIKRSTDAPPKVKRNPFYYPEFWGRANSPDDIYLPDSDEALSFAWAAHEIGHLIKKGERNDASLDNFDANLAEEQRAWDMGWPYLQKYIDEYYQNSPERVPKIHQAYGRIKKLAIEAVFLSKDMFLKNGALDNLNPEEINRILEEKREKFFSERGNDFKNIFDEMKKEKIGVKPDWNKFTAVVAKAVENILKDNNQE